VKRLNGRELQVYLVVVLRQSKSLIVVGSSGAGKTSLVQSVRTPEFEELVSVPLRLTTRERRNDDVVAENWHLSQEEFDERVANGTIWPHWLKPLGDTRSEQYGFDLTPLASRWNYERPELTVFSGNNALLRDPHASKFSLLNRSLIVVVTASPEVREARLAARSPDMPAEERAVRLQDDGSDLLSLPFRTLNIDTSDLTTEQGQDAFQSIVRTELSPH
jgi:ribose 1,5-bisphosphokinase PhnN